MAVVRVEPAALADWHADAGSALARLREHLQDADRAAAALTAGWSGASADRFDGHWTAFRGAAARQLETLAQLRELVRTAHANYSAAIAANRAIWGARTGPATVAPAALLPDRLHVDTDDMRSTVATLGTASRTLVDSWSRLATALTTTGGMAGDDGAVAADYAGSTAAVWTAWRSAGIMLLAIAGGIAESGNNVLEAEHASTPGGSPPDPISLPDVVLPVPTPPPPAVAAAPTGLALAGLLAPYWPTADVDLLRSAAAAWRAAATAPEDAGADGIHAVAGLATANPDPAIALAEEFAREALSTDPTTGLFGVLGLHCRDIATACDALADATLATRAAIRDAVVELLVPHEWYDAVAAVLDAVVSRGAAELVARGGDVSELFLHLRWIADQHAARVRDIVRTLSPVASARLERLAGGAPAPTYAAAATGPVATPPASDRQALIDQLRADGRKINPAETLQVARAADGRIVWFERGGNGRGLSHVLRFERLADFDRNGVPPEDVPTIAVRAVTTGRLLGRVGKDATAYAVPLNGRTVDVVVVEGSNGYLVTTYPLKSRSKLRPGGR